MKKRVQIVVAVDANWGIGRNNIIPWNIPEDFKHFMGCTKLSHCIMGKNTYLELVEMKKNRLGEKYDSTQPILKDRHSIVMSNTLNNENHNDCLISNLPLSVVMSTIDMSPLFSNISILGGSSIFEQCMQYVDEIIITKIPQDYSCTELFPVNTMNRVGFYLSGWDTLNTQQYGDIVIERHLRKV